MGGNSRSIMNPSILVRLALVAIRAYQRYLSPYKGFVCSYRLHTGRDSCSAYGYRVIARHGLRRGLGLLARRMGECGEQHRLHAPQRRSIAHAHAQTGLRHQAGYCDLPCDLPCDLDDGKAAGRAAWRAAGCACEMAPDCSCDLVDHWLDKWREKRRERRARRQAENQGAQ